MARKKNDEGGLPLPCLACLDIVLVRVRRTFSERMKEAEIEDMWSKLNGWKFSKEEARKT
jgi:hypothetical protein